MEETHGFLKVLKEMHMCEMDDNEVGYEDLEEESHDGEEREATDEGDRITHKDKTKSDIYIIL